MTKKTRFKAHLQTLNKIGTMMTAMRNLSFIEMNRVTKCLATQERMNAMIQQMGSDFLSSYPQLLTQVEVVESNLYILIGAERGFCGGFNDNLVRYLETHLLHHSINNPKIIIVGQKLAAKMINDQRVIQVIAGPNTVDEISNIILNVINALTLVFTQLKISSWNIVFNKKIKTRVEATVKQPFMEFRNIKQSDFTISPQLNLSHQQFMIEFMNQYVFFMLYSLFYQSFFAENYNRANHLDSALERLRKKVTCLTHSINLLRQEEINLGLVIWNKIQEK
ncbi:F0F1 ATP synthase subunit gamma [Legionella sp. PATHC038]|uniref:F0F1 ATP synthase subunit gamma n=1 Tax=Legionella sheltonii TaxID=2992041 RepID=UPI00224472E1|nr:FoF1 ATP synthase subunit gamma [Legionella sp. PATHC038]MCW8400322.1 F0F1 ATP synthase subunit gamma [Legionella sp. PATHC038]